MKNRIAALALALALIAALGASAVSAAGASKIAGTGGMELRAEQAKVTAAAVAAGTATFEADAADTVSPEGALAFADVRNRMLAGFYPLRAMEEQAAIIEELDYGKLESDLREQLNSIAKQQWMMTVYRMGDSYTDALMQQGYDAVREKFDAIRDGDLQKDNAELLRQMRDAENQLIMAGELLFIGLKSGEAQRSSVQRAVEKTERTLREMELRHELGQVSTMAVEQVRTYRSEALSGEKTLEMSLENNLLQLKAMAGAALDQPLTLGALPKVTAEQLAAMALDTDLVRAEEASYELFEAKKALDDAKKAYDDCGYIDISDATYNQMRSVHIWRAARYTYQNTVQSFELRFRTLYAQVKDAAQTLDAKQASLASQEREYAAAALKYEQGNLSANALADAKDALADAKDALAGAERDLFSKYRTYYWAVEYGILNG